MPLGRHVFANRAVEHIATERYNGSTLNDTH